MCGILYAKSFLEKPVNNKIEMLYRAQRNRGSEGFGFYQAQENKLVVNTDERAILHRLDKAKATEIMFHHRMPTSTANVQNACHPFSTRGLKHNYVMIHNGIIHNTQAMADKHYQAGLSYVSVQADRSFNDSECLAYELGLYLDGVQNKIEAFGWIAFIIQASDTKEVWFGRNSVVPLSYKINGKGLVIGSEVGGTQCSPDKIYHFDPATKQVTVKPLNLPSSEWDNQHQYDWKNTKRKFRRYEDDFDTISPTGLDLALADEADELAWDNEAQSYLSKHEIEAKQYSDFALIEDTATEMILELYRQDGVRKARAYATTKMADLADELAGLDEINKWNEATDRDLETYNILYFERAGYSEALEQIKTLENIKGSKQKRLLG